MCPTNNTYDSMFRTNKCNRGCDLVTTTHACANPYLKPCHIGICNVVPHCMNQLCSMPECTLDKKHAPYDGWQALRQHRDATQCVVRLVECVVVEGSVCQFVARIWSPFSDTTVNQGIEDEKCACVCEVCGLLLSLCLSLSLSSLSSQATRIANVICHQ